MLVGARQKFGFLSQRARLRGESATRGEGPVGAALEILARAAAGRHGGSRMIPSDSTPKPTDRPAKPAESLACDICDAAHGARNRLVGHGVQLQSPRSSLSPGPRARGDERAPPFLQCGGALSLCIILPAGRCCGAAIERALCRSLDQHALTITSGSSSAHRALVGNVGAGNVHLGDLGLEPGPVRSGRGLGRGRSRRT